MTIAAYFAIAACILLSIGLAYVLGLDSHQIAKLAVERAPTRKPLMKPMPIYVPGVAFAVIAAICVGGVLGPYRSTGPVSVRELATFETIQEAVKSPQVAVSNEAYLEAFKRVVDSGADAKSVHVSAQTSDQNARGSCSKFLSRTGARLAPESNPTLSDTEASLIQYCVTRLKSP